MENATGGLPDVRDWQPISAKDDTLSNSLMITCQIAQARILARVEAEIRFNLHNFDSGLSVEDIVRDELANLLPDRYAVTSGIVSDRRGYTAGHCDLIVRDHTWSPVIKPGVTGASRRFHFPIEGIYAVTEIKQSLGPNELDDAMKKLVTVSRLERPYNPFGHITENQHLNYHDRQGVILNPLYTAVLGARLPSGYTFEDIADRFGTINARLERDSMVKMLCVLGHGTAWYSVSTGNPINATYMLDRDQPLILQINHNEPENSFYRLYGELLGHGTRSVLGLANMISDYGQPPPTRLTQSYEAAEFNKTS